MRREKDVKIEMEGRDLGKVFRITEMSAAAGEWWATRAFLALANSGADLGQVPEGAGMAGLALVGLRALGMIRAHDAKPLLDEMMACVKIVPDPDKNPGFARELVAEDIEEIATIVHLRSEVFELHTDFSIRDAILRSLAERDLLSTQTTSGGSPTSQS